MELYDIKKYKVDMENEITKLISTFSDKTGVHVTNITVAHFINEPISTTETFSGYRARLDVEIDWMSNVPSGG